MRRSWRATPSYLALVMLLPALTTVGCSGSPALDAKPVIELAGPAAGPPAALLEPCADPVEPSGKNAGPVERDWTADRLALLSCGSKHLEVITFYQDRDRGLAGK